MGINSKDKRDVYYKMSKKEGYRARSVYKLIQIDEDFDILKGSKRIVDLCGAPGSWSQYVSSSDREVISVDIQNMEPIKGVTILKEDITTVKCVDKIKSTFKGNLADLVLFDGAPDVTGIHSLDEYLQVQLILMALSITLQISEMSSTFVGKIFRGKYTKHLIFHFKKFYKEVFVVKPKASRSSSIESFILAKGLFCKLKKDFELSETEEIEVKSCGSGPDPDLTQENNEEEVCRPTVLPIDPPYLESILNRRNE